MQDIDWTSEKKINDAILVRKFERMFDIPDFWEDSGTFKTDLESIFK